jgi:hypothetical protein
MNTGKPYEALTEQVFQRLLAQERLCVNVRRDTIVQGKSTAHQIDVCFDFKVGTTKYLTIVQCKDWASAVKQEQVLAFLAVLQDIPGQPRGIMVTRSRFQKGAREVARKNGIELYELRAPKDEDWNGLIRTVQIELVFIRPEFRCVCLKPDIEWLRGECRRLQIPKGEEPTIAINPEQLTFHYESGSLCDLRMLMSSHAPPGPCDWTPIAFDLPDPLFAELPDGPIPTVRFASITAEGRIVECRRTSVVNADHLVAYCFRDVMKGTVRFLGVEGGPLDQEGA